MKNLANNAKFYFIAIGGIGMSGLAKILLEKGYSVSGSDLNSNNLTEYLQSKGAEIFKGHSSENIQDQTAVIKSTAIRDTNPELQKAVSENIPVMHRAGLLNEIMSGYKTSVGITGMHGKTTTTGMITTIFHELGLDPGFAAGGEIPQLKTNAAAGSEDYFIAELDESDRTVELYTPDISVITNLEYEHAEHYPGGFKQVIEVFERFINRLNPESKVIINIDDEGNRQLIQKIGIERFITYSTQAREADYYLKDRIKINVPGEHNISNATAAIAAAMEAGIGFEEAASAILKYCGMKKRFQTLGCFNNVQIVDDYAHHPTEIKATLKTAKSLNKKRVIGVFQPHRYTRLSSLWGDFLKCFDDADILYICDVFSAEEVPIENINSEMFHKNLQHPSAYYIKGELDSVADAVIKEMRPEDIVITMGAGTITKLGTIILAKTKGKSLKCL